MPIIPANEFAIYIDAFVRRGQSGSTDAIFPRFMEDNAIFTYPAFPVGIQWRDGGISVQNFAGAAGASFIVDSTTARTALRYYQAISATHDDPVARRLTIAIQDSDTGLSTEIASVEGAVADQILVVPRPIVIGERHLVLAIVDAIAAGQFVRLRTYSVQQGLGSDLPGL